MNNIEKIKWAYLIFSIGFAVGVLTGVIFTYTSIIK